MMLDSQDSDIMESSLPELPDPDSIYSLSMLTMPPNVFWNQCRPWLAKQGVVLYELRPYKPNEFYKSYFWHSPANTGDSETPNLPYAICTHKCDSPSAVMDGEGCRRVACARDAMHRDIVVKVIRTGSMEHQIYQRIHEVPAELFTDGSTFPCVLPPTALLDSQRGYTFVAMPQWGCPTHIGDIQTVGGAMQFMRCYLQDVWDYNTAINRRTPFWAHSEEHREALRAHRGESDIFYALMDFDQSALFPIDASLEECRLPLSAVDDGANLYKPRDTQLAPAYYNPFAFDVGAAGFLFRRYFPTVVPFAPGLAALFDRMTERSKRRFSAAEALLFLRGLEDHSSPDVLETEVALQLNAVETMDDANVYWSKLSPEDICLWDPYRTPVQPLWARSLDWMATHVNVWIALRFFRQTLRF
ncbi:hypothetical protein C2E23DRAFT_31856 [Lenzites betulinus]|nr:hypothetical protein C2E23DRAFT_31856 [Lenzites betulinus]